MVDVARVAGVAHVTVSRVLNGSPSVRPETVARVRAAIDQLGYRRNDVARALKSGSTMSLGVVVAGSGLHEFSRMLLGLETAASAGGYGIALARWQGEGVESLSAALDRLTDRGADGVLVLADRPVAVAALEGLTARVPVSVVMSGALDHPRITSVEIDQRLGARLATRHLLELGHRSVVHLAGDLTMYDARARVEGWRAELAAAGVHDAEMLVGDFESASGYRLGLELAARRELPTAVFAANDAMAMGVLAACAERGVAVPEQLSLVGFDDIHGAGYLVPSLTTVRQDHEALGRLGVETLLGLLAGEEARHHLIVPTLVPRRSSAPPRHASPAAASTPGAVPTSPFPLPATGADLV